MSATSVLLPVLFVMALGYWAGISKRFNAEQTRGLNELVMTFALPALMFVATVTTSRSEMLAEARFLVGILLAFLGLYILIALFSVWVLGHRVGAAGLQAFLITFPSVAFFGIPIFKGLFGEASLVSIATADVLASITIAPLTIVLLEIQAQHSASGETQRVAAFIGKGVANSFAKPMVWAPLLGSFFVLLEIDFPREIDNMLALIGSTTGGASLFLAGLIIASYSITISRDIAFNIIGKLLLQPALMALLVVLLPIPNPLGREAVLMCAIPASAVGPMLAAHYRLYEQEAASTVVLDSVLMLISFSVVIVLTGS